MRAILGRGNFPENNINIVLGGSKSESNRLLILRALLKNISLKNLSESDDTSVLEKGLEITTGSVDIHHAGSAMRFLTAYYAAKEGTEIILTGSKRMQERPIGILVDALKSLGADIEYLKEEGFPPLKIKGKSLHKREVKIKSDVSSQYISALMLISPMLPGGLHIFLEGKPASRPYIEMTLSLLKEVGIRGKFCDNEIEIFPVKDIVDVEIAVESDWSSASYFYGLTALSEDFKITLRHFGKKSLQGDSVLPAIYRSLGVHTDFNEAEKSITLYKKNVPLPDTLMLDLSNCPDLAQTVAVTCFGLGIGCTLTGLGTLKIKETDRLLALKNELSKLGATIQIDESSLTMEKAIQINPGQTIETYQDHRMAMAFAPLSIKTNLTIKNAEVVSKSYRNFWEDLKITGIKCDFF